MYLIELLIIIAVICLQFYISGKVSHNISILKDIFHTKLVMVYKLFYLEESKKGGDINQYLSAYSIDQTVTEIPENSIKIALLDSLGSDNVVLIRIKNALNNYLINNYGAEVNFNIIKDIIDREVDATDEGVANSVSTPLYLGLAATMIGIILGLLSMPEMSSANFNEGIGALIDGVKVAMVGSLVGVLCTTYLSAYRYRIAKAEVLQGKNTQLAYLQAKLLPELYGHDSGVVDLRLSLDKFSKEARKISVEVNSAMQKTGGIISSQHAIIDKIEKMNMVRVSKVNLELFDKLDSNMAAFSHFSEFIATMGSISENLKDFANKTSNINSIAANVDANIEDAKKLSRFLAEHFEKIETLGGAALRAVDLSDKHFRESIVKLTEESMARINRLNQTADIQHNELLKVYGEIVDSLESSTAKHISEFEQAYKNAVPNFGQLNHLTHLQPIHDTLASKTDVILAENQAANRDIVRHLATLAQGLQRNESQDISLIVQKLNEISQKLSPRKESGEVGMDTRWQTKVLLYVKISAYVIVSSAAVMYMIYFFKKL